MFHTSRSARCREKKPKILIVASIKGNKFTPSIPFWIIVCASKTPKNILFMPTARRVNVLLFDEEKRAILPITMPNNNQESMFTYKEYNYGIRDNEKICKRCGRRKLLRILFDNF